MTDGFVQPETDHGLLIENAVEIVDDVAHVRVHDRLFALSMEGAPVSAFAPGWSAGALFIGFAPLLVLEFRNVRGEHGQWYLDHRFNYVASHVDKLPPDLREVLIAQAVPVLREMAACLIRTDPPPFGALAEAFMALASSTRREIAIALSEQLFPRPKSYIVEDFADALTPVIVPADPALPCLPLSCHHLRAGFGIDWQDRLIEAAAMGGTLWWPSPIDGVPLACQGSVVFDDFYFLYRFVDERCSLIFYAVVWDHRSCVAGLWFPSTGILISENDARRGVVLWLRPRFGAVLAEHLVMWAPNLAAYFSRQKAAMANVMRGIPGLHVGHQLWNEMTGISRVVDRVADSRLRHLVLGRNPDLELYGPIDEVFPQIRGQVRRDLSSHAELIADAYETGTIVVRTTHDVVTAPLRARLLDQARKSAATRGVHIPDGPMIIFGLRVENRTLADLAGFLHRFMSMVVSEFPDLTVVFDGHNANGETQSPIHSHGEWMARLAPHEVERQLVARLREDFPHHRDRIADTLMQPVSTSLVMAQACCGFVSIWGASLAKYRWVANLPGFVITSAHNLQYRSDLDIYHSARYMEDSAEVQFVDRAAVTDLPEAEQLVPVGRGNPSFNNFALDETAVLGAIRGFLRDRLAAQTPGPTA